MRGLDEEKPQQEERGHGPRRNLLWKSSWVGGFMFEELSWRE